MKVDMYGRIIIHVFHDFQRCIHLHLILSAAVCTRLLIQFVSPTCFFSPVVCMCNTNSNICKEFLVHLQT